MRKFLFFLWLLFVCLISAGANAISIIRDTEAEAWLTHAVRQIFGAAGLDPDNAEVVIVNDPSINAFVAGGQTIFIHTGLILKAQTPDELMFVLSHETGHIVGGHVTRGYQELKNAQTTALISTVIGGVLAVAGGRPDAGIAIMAGGQMSSVGLFTKYRQTEESSADRIAVDIMNKLGYSMKGFEGVMKSIKAEERLNRQSEYSYLRTHPMTQTRVAELERFLKSSKPVHQDLSFDLMRAKLYGFLELPEKTFKLYSGNTLPDLYARAIANYRKNDFKKAFQILDDLLLKQPDNPYFHELKGQLFFETGKLKEAAENYKKAFELKSDSGLIALSYAQVLLEIGGIANARKAEDLLHYVVQEDIDSTFGWQLLAKAYHGQKKSLNADYAMVEYFRALGTPVGLEQAKKRAQKIKDSFPKNSITYQRLQDILEVQQSL
ncbi:MAG: M48 family metalloprotease [Alphaproteobacteria bacterium]|nr:M48 family metalloprotease [Alphaproteobacteria bacterium]